MSHTIAPRERAEAHRYTLVIEWSDENDAYLAIAPDLPGLMTDGRTPAEAAAMGEEAVVTLLASPRNGANPCRLPPSAPSPTTFVRRAILPTPA
jgi:predicted RNase H-like HicB family nuclease